MSNPEIKQLIIIPVYNYVYEYAQLAPYMVLIV